MAKYLEMEASVEIDLEALFKEVIRRVVEEEKEDTALGVILGVVFTVYKWYLKREKEEEDIRKI